MAEKRKMVERWLDHAKLDFMGWKSQPDEMIEELWYSFGGEEVEYLMGRAMITGLKVQCPDCKRFDIKKPQHLGDRLRFRWQDLRCPQGCNEKRIRTGAYEDLEIVIYYIG